MRLLRVLREAEDELADAAERYESKRVGLGIELIFEVDRAFEEIRSAPMSRNRRTATGEMRTGEKDHKRQGATSESRPPHRETLASVLYRGTDLTLGSQ